MSSIIYWIYHNREESQPLPYQGHRNPAFKEMLREDPVSIQGHRPQDDSGQHVDNEIYRRKLAPPLDALERLFVEWMNNIVEIG